jgi:hypothetical protein
MATLLTPAQIIELCFHLQKEAEDLLDLTVKFAERLEHDSCVEAHKRLRQISIISDGLNRDFVAKLTFCPSPKGKKV